MSNLIRQGDANLASFGQFGCKHLTTGQQYNGTKTVIAIQSLSDSTDVTATSEDTDVWDSLSSVVVCCGVTIFGRWSNVSLLTSQAGASVIIYFAE